MDFDVADLGLESVVDVSKEPSLLDERRADAIVWFPEPITNPNRFFGDVDPDNSRPDGHYL
nr:hypothetical protein [Halobacterium jilantaiense]